MRVFDKHSFFGVVCGEVREEGMEPPEVASLPQEKFFHIFSFLPVSQLFNHLGRPAGTGW